MDRFDVMRLFMRVADAGSFSVAAREAGVGQPTVSKRIAALEARLGGQLIRRTSRDLALTAAGRAFYDTSVRLLDALDAAEAQVAQQDSAVAGLVRLTAPPAFATMFLFPRLPAFFARYPEIIIELLVSQNYLNLIEGGIDVAIRMGELADSDLRSRRIGTVDAVTVASTAYLAAHGTPTTPAELAGHSCIASVRRGAARAWRFVGPAGEIRIAPSGRIRTNDTDHSRGAMRAGLGIVQGPNWLFAPDIADGTARVVLADFQAGGFPINAVWPGDRALTARSRTVIEFVAQACGEEATLRLRG